MPAAKTTNAGAELKVEKTLPPANQAASRKEIGVRKKGAARGVSALHLIYH
jgi:hypothetical protein